jgi:hypothetical protein
MQRQEVYKILDTERDYQDQQILSPSRPDMRRDLTVGDTLNIIQYNLDKAREEWYQGHAPHKSAMNYLRKIAGTIVMMGENIGMPERV